MQALQVNSGIEVTGRRTAGLQAILRLADGSQLPTRRFAPVGQGDYVRREGEELEVFVRNDQHWAPLSSAWVRNSSANLGGASAPLTFKEVETPEEFEQFEQLKRLHYRSGSGVGRTVPIIAVAHRWDLPLVLGFLEISSSMIASTARKRFFSGSFFENKAIQWNTWNSTTARSYSNLICRISRFVIHPELRGSGLAAQFLDAAKDYAAERWHYGGWQPRFMEITADMLRYYKFLGDDFGYMGETEGNEHRLAKDMAYLVKKALTAGDRMPQGGGGIMTLQRGYASQLMEFALDDSRGVTQLVQQLSQNPASLDQQTWEALHRLNRRPKPSYVCGLTEKAKGYVRTQDIRLNQIRQLQNQIKPKSWRLTGLNLSASSQIDQTSDGRLIQEAFGFVGGRITSDLLKDLSFSLTSGEITLLCGASGSGKSLLLHSCASLLQGRPASDNNPDVNIEGTSDMVGVVKTLPDLPLDASALSLKGSESLERFLDITGKCGLAEPQLLIRPIRTLSSGQRYRLAVALAFIEGCDILLIDNFCEPLDRYTASAVAKGISRLAKSESVSVLAATATYDRSYLLNVIDQAILLSRGGRATVIKRGSGHGLQESFFDDALSDKIAK